MGDYNENPKNHCKDAQNQTNEEWLDEYNCHTGKFIHASDKPVSPVHAPGKIVTQLPQNKVTGSPEQLFRYLDHRTTCRGCVAMEFESLDRSIRATAFFNGKLTSPRGKSYPAGSRGQFFPPPMGAFRKFWMQAVGKEPPCGWTRVQKSMRSKLGALVFTGEIKYEIDSKGQSYLKLTNVRAQSERELDIKWA